MKTDVAKKLEGLRKDFATKAGHPFKHFYCPILFRDDDVELCQAHIINEAFRGSARSWTVQRIDVDSFYGSAFESDFVLLQERGQHDPLDVLVDRSLSRKLKPTITVGDNPVEHYYPTGPLPPTHSELLVERDGRPTTRLAIKLSPADALAALERSWDIRIEADVHLPALVSLLKAAHLTMFEMTGYEYGLSAAAHFVGYDILGRFFLANRRLTKSEILANAASHFRQFVNLVRPIVSAPPDLKGTISDRLLYLCSSRSKPWAILVLVRTGQHLHAVMLPVLEDADSAARFISFLQSPTPSLDVRLTRFAGEKWEMSPTTHTFMWPEPNFD
jgi:hypothetical protein